jgi:hypothetical protein
MAPFVSLKSISGTDSTVYQWLFNLEDNELAFMPGREETFINLTSGTEYKDFFPSSITKYSHLVKVKDAAMLDPLTEEKVKVEEAKLAILRQKVRQLQFDIFTGQDKIGRIVKRNQKNFLPFTEENFEFYRQQKEKKKVGD